jgi:hypothetical protein
MQTKYQRKKLEKLISLVLGVHSSSLIQKKSQSKAGNTPPESANIIVLCIKHYF